MATRKRPDDEGTHDEQTEKDEHWLAAALETAPNGAVEIAVFRDVGKGAAHRGPSYAPMPATPDDVRRARERLLETCGPGSYYLQERLAGNKLGRLARCHVGAPLGWQPPTTAAPSTQKTPETMAGVAALVAAAAPIVTALLARPSSPIDDLIKLHTAKLITRSTTEEGGLLEAIKLGASMAKTGAAPKSEVAEIVGALGGIFRSAPVATTTNAVTHAATTPPPPSSGSALAAIVDMLTQYLRGVVDGHLSLADALESLRVLLGEEPRAWVIRHQDALTPILNARPDIAALVDRSGFGAYLTQG
jgi:hypothetical protein